MEGVVLELLRGLPASFWPRPCKRIREWQEEGKAPSSNTGAYHQARPALPLTVVEQSCDHIFEELVAQLDGGSSGEGRTFVLDGSSIRMPHSPALVKPYPPGRNQPGKSHWPLLRVLVAHEVRTGRAMRPEWGPMHGPDAVSEPGLLETARARLPKGATVLGDRNFGVFSVAWAAAQSGHPVRLRMKVERAERRAGERLQEGRDRRVIWKPSPYDRKSHPELPAEAAVEGRLVVRQVQPSNGTSPFLLARFTTLPGSATHAVDLYGERWTIETDIRTLKSQLRLEQLPGTTPAMVAKEIDTSIAAYNLVRAMICLAADQCGAPPRAYRFTKVRRILQTFGPLLAHANARKGKRILDQMMRYVQPSRRAPRKRPSSPRTVWRKPAAFPNRKS
jgi:hypothetical protein